MMKRRAFIILTAILFLFIMPQRSSSQQDSVYNCRQYIHSWEIPKWSIRKDDYISPILSIDENFSEQGNASLKLTVSFHGENWSAGIVETEGVFDLTLYKAISCDVYLPKSAPEGIEARIVIVTGEDYLWLEMKNSVVIKPGYRTTVIARLRQGSRSWKSIIGEEKITDEIKANVRTIAIRVESNIVEYKGPIYIDNIRLIK